MLDALLDAAPSERPALLTTLSHGDTALEAELARLVAQCESPHPVLDRPVGENFGDVLYDQEGGFPESLAARYRVSEVIGEGGMAVVYLARDVKHNRDVAVKVIRSEVAATVGRDRFLREIAIVATLQHPHIVSLYDSGDADGSLYYVMPYEEGHSLRDRMRREGPLPIRETVAILRDVCDALAHAHRRGVVHRDIKPENVLLSGEHAMVADFGIARAVHGSADSVATLTGVSVGTPAYMAPEQIAADPSIDHRADIYAVGVVAHEMLAGKRPFDATTPQAILAAHLTQAPEPVTARRTDVPPGLAEVIAKCLEKQPDARWQNMDELVRRLDEIGAAAIAPPRAPQPSRARLALVGLGLGVAMLALIAWLLLKWGNAGWQNPLANARVERLTDLPGSELDASISSDGRFAVFLADSGGQFDALVTQIGSGQFLNLTGGRLPELFNEDVRNVGFTGDGSRVWIRAAGIANTPSVSLVPTLGGQLQPFLERAVMAVWSPDGRRVAYHEGGNDPIFVADQNGRNARRIFVAPAGRHCHYLAWSPDGRYLYFSYGVPPDNMDIWRIPADSGVPERLTHHDATVGYPVLLDRRTLLYVATADDGTGPWLYSMDVDERIARRVTTGVEHTLSVAAAAPTAGTPRRLVTTVSNPTVNLWSVAITAGVAEERDARPLDRVPTARARGPRFSSNGSLFYLASRSGADGMWRLRDGAAIELWSATDGAVVGAPAISPDGKSVCAPVRRNDRSRLYCSTADGTDGRVLAESLDVRGAGSWSPDGKWIAITAQDTGGVRIYKVPLDGGPPVRLVATVSSNPVWSPDGTFIVYSGAPRARTVPVLAVRPDGQSYSLPPITVDRIGDSYRFLPGSGRELVLKQGGFRRQDFHLLDLTTGQTRQLTRLRGGESLLRFDVSPDGRQILFERVRENSDVVLIELPR